MENIQDIYPLSPMQEGMLFHSISAPDQSEYKEQFSCKLRGKLDLEAFKETWSFIIERHDILRTAFIWEDVDEPLQIVQDSVELPFEYFDISSSNEKGKEFSVICDDSLSKPIEFNDAPLMNIVLVKFDENEHGLIWNHHHILFDGWGLPILMQEFVAIYESKVKNDNLTLESTFPYKNYIEWLKSNNEEELESFWRKYLSEFSNPTYLKFPLTDKPKAGYENYKYQISEEITSKVIELVKNEQLTTNSLFQAAWSLLLSYYTNSNDVIFGATFSGRNADVPGIDSMVGLFINTLPIRAKLDSEKSIIGWLKEFQIQQAKLQEYEYSPLFKVQKWADIPKDAPLFNSILVFENYPVSEALEESESVLSFEDVESVSKTNYPITFVISPGKRIGIEIAYDTENFDKNSIKQICRTFDVILAQLVSNSDKIISQIKFAEKEELLKEIVNISGEVREVSFTNIVDNFESIVLKYPDKIALVKDDIKLTFTELNKKANQFARSLSKHQNNKIVGVCLNRSIEMVVSLIAVNKIGSAFIPIDIDYPIERINTIIEDSELQLIITEVNKKDQFTSNEINIITINDLAEESNSQEIENINNVIHPEEVCYIIYTSGSTGKPKGVCLEHKGLVNFVNNTIIDFEFDNENVLQFSSFGFDAAIGEIYSSLLSGGTLYIPERDITLSEGDLVKYLNENKITFAYLPPSFLSVIDANSFSSNLKIASVGDKCSNTLADKWGSKLTFFNGYGPTESTIGATYLKYTKKYSNTKTYPIGKGFGNISIYILDHNLKQVSNGVEGELFISGETVARGYLNNLIQTAETFLPDPYSKVPGRRMYKTGDQAVVLPDGNIEFIGRKDFQVKIRGFRIELNEIESVILNYNKVQDALVIADKAEKGNEYLVGYVIPKDNSLNENELTDYLKQELPEYMLPKGIIILDEFPLTSNKKVDRIKLPKLETSELNNYESPKTNSEQIIANIWSDILNVENVSRNSNFFELGGHSLLATQLISRMRDAFNKEISFKLFFDSSTLKQLAENIDNEININQSNITIEKVDRNSPIPLSFSQQRLWFLDKLKPDDTSYNIPSVFRIEGKLNFDLIGVTWNLILRKHESLRTTFYEIDGKPFQRINDVAEHEIEIVDITETTENEKLDAVKNYVKEEAQQPFKLNELPLIKFRILKLSENDNVIFILAHHIIADGWSISLIFNDFIEFYNKLKNDEEVILDEKNIQFADYANWQQNIFSKEGYTKQLEFWKNNLKDIPNSIELTYDKPKPKVQSNNSDSINVVIDKHKTAQLNKIAQQENSTMYMILLAIYQVLLSKYSNSNDIVVGSPIAGRNNKQIESIVGFFVNNLAIRTIIDKSLPFNELLADIRNNVVSSYSNQDIPFDKIVEEIQPNRDLSHQPIFQVLFVYQNLPSTEKGIDDLKVLPIDLGSYSTNYQITLTLQETENGLVGSFEYNSDLFEKESIEIFNDHFVCLVDQIIEDHEKEIQDLKVLSENERNNLLKGINQGIEKNVDLNVIEKVEKIASEFPDQPAVVFNTNEINGKRSLSYSDFLKKYENVSNYLSSKSVKNEEIIAICMNRHEDIIVSMFGIMKSGCAFLPIDPTLPTERIQYMLEAANCSKIITNNETIGTLSNFEKYLLNIDFFENTSVKNYSANIEDENLAYIIFTSGSTGKPKGVMLNHKGLANLSDFQKEIFEIDNTKKVLQFASNSFDASVWETVMAITNGATLYLTTKEIISSGLELSKYLDQHNITTITLPPSVLTVLEINNLPNLKTVITAGEAISNELAKKWTEGRNYFNAYGPTETTVCATIYSWDKEYPKFPPIGKSISNFETYVLDQNLNPVGVGIPGELCVGGIGLARGYINQSDLTAEKFIPNYFSDEEGSRLYRTGDLVRYLPDGNIEFLGRIDSQVKFRGFRIETSEIEQVLLQNDEIKNAVVALKNVNGLEKLIAYLIVENEEFSKENIISYLRDSLPDYMIPSAFVPMDNFPVNTSGKIDYKILPIPEMSRDDISAEYVAPRNEDEEKLVNIVKELLSVEKVGVKDNFFELGGHSLLATQFISRIKDVFGKEIKLIKVFEDPTIEGVLKNILSADSEVQTKRPTIQRVSRDSRRINRNNLN